MRILSIFVILLLLGIPASVRAQTTAPVTINSCGPMLSKDSRTSILGIPLASSSSGIQIQFVNDTQKTASLVNFAVDSNGQSFVIRDVGTFSPGISINHQYRNGAGQSFVLPQFIAPQIKCAVQSVRFTDGTGWRQGETLQSRATPNQAKLSASPANLQVDHASKGALFMVMSDEPVAGFSERNSCSGIATVSLAVTGSAASTYSVAPIAPGSCAATIKDESGNSISVPINVQ